MTKAHFGMIGLGTMGRNFLLNIAEHGISGVGYDLDADKRALLLQEGAGMPVAVGVDLPDFLAKLESPRNIMLLVPAGPIVDKVIADLVPHLDPDDLIIDGGNSHFTDTDCRIAELDAKNIGFMGIGVSGGEEGARHGASIMPGGKIEYYKRIETTLQAVSAKVGSEPCVAYMGSGSAGHFVKMVHNGIEYGLMQLIAETYDHLKTVAGMQSDEIARVFSKWNAGHLNSFLIEITSTVLQKRDPESGQFLVDEILDTAGQKGTGKWTSQAAMDLGVPVPTIDSAVTMRQISSQKKLRGELSKCYDFAIPQGHSPLSVEELERALKAAFVVTYAQGLSMLAAASKEHGYGLDIAEIARIWRGGCIIRSALLEDIMRVYSATPELETILMDSDIAKTVGSNALAIRKMVSSAVGQGIPAMCFAATLAYFDAFRSERLPANLIQAQRDYFGAHTYQRTDKEGTFHTPDWDQ
ncbi:MAG TPA: NADP-dependent phosphogluconate dehydrogenase [Pyrinomonadaceae bacterium]|nr:NADP-dependent phosphogluconate dehydrogenase [Chloracidobacterium sp.]MBL0239064.1 NADP-dependent phosphogluconate dehydrogenase [Chloracidobacterium sp.]MBP9936598.1 NADP-dependent phosphogluconate dehydrogenase [Pyrinomonadaceae bacterium]HQY67326.1 NADP-dependent phosphogluconate dehydrogenase [Pyrinomonadaceae bacterium]HRA40881.1 NADP-dependent phosphogluconate dehydrogenase [Pyrinomonadaceae bacterium]